MAPTNVCTHQHCCIRIEWAGAHRGIDVLGRVAAAAPSAELTGAEGAQLDEEDMGMSYDELGVSCAAIDASVQRLLDCKHHYADQLR